MLPKDKADWFLEQIRVALKQGGLRKVKYSLAGSGLKGLNTASGPDGDIHFEGHIQPLPIDIWGERAVVWSARNITPQYELEMKLRELSETDSLTGLFNRRKFLEQLDKCFKKYKRYNRPTALVIFDIDYFKLINDNFGHSVGDDVLRRLAGKCAAQLRDLDSLYRIGGEEFAVILLETNAKDAFWRADRLRQVSENLKVEPGGVAGKVSISLGVSEFIANGRS